MWSAIAESISFETGMNFNIQQRHEVAGGDVNIAYVVEGIANPNIKNGVYNSTQKKYFVKINNKDKLALFDAELDNLKHITNLTPFQTTTPITLGTTLDKSFFVLDHKCISLSRTENWYQLGKQLADMHLNTTHGQFGWHQDNYIGNTLQINRWQSNWRTFFSEQRIGWQLQLLAEKSIKIGDINHIIKICHDLLLHHNTKPCLVHGDLWQGNVGFVNSQPIIYDPACYYGDREVDLAMTELFGAFPNEFYQGYEQAYPLDNGYHQRKMVYNFYHILNHVNMFNHDYLEQAKSTLARIISEYQVNF